MVPNRYCTFIIVVHIWQDMYAICIQGMVFYFGEIKTDMETQQYYYSNSKAGFEVFVERKKYLTFFRNL
jgi:hypothetical protein